MVIERTAATPLLTDAARKASPVGSMTRLLSAVAVSLAVAAGGSSAALAQQPAGAAIEEVVVTGSRIVRDGYDSPTPTTVVGSEQIQSQAAPNLIDYLTNLPSFAGNYTPQSSSQNVSSGAAGTASVNLRNLGTNRTLVLLDGQRSVPSTITGLVDVNTIPQQLIERVEVVTGGASAAYGSDAVSGVVNFILDKDYVGFKSELSGGITSYGDNGNFSIAMTAGTEFANGRGHLIVSGQEKRQHGIITGDRPWNLQGWQIINNPDYTDTNGQPRRLLLSEIAPSNATPGGLIVDGPLRGVAVGEGGTPYQFQFGPLISGSAMQGGDWEDSSLHLVGQSIEPRIGSRNLFARASFALTDATEIYFQSNWYKNSNYSHAYPNDGYFGGLMIQADNPFIPASVAAQIATLGITEFEMGHSLRDMGTVSIDTGRVVTRNVLGITGDFDAFGSSWGWDAYYQYGVSEGSESAYNSSNLVAVDEAMDSVIDPDTGAIVCRSSLTDPGNGCVPYNPFGIGVNTSAALDYVVGDVSHRDQKFVQESAGVAVQGAPFTNWAGDVSFATGLEYRKEKSSGASTELDLQRVFFAGNYRPTFGEYDVTELFMETIVPLAVDKSWARALDLNAAVRFTDYSTSGSVETWKAGLTYMPIDSLTLRTTVSRDIRAPNLSDLFNAGLSVNQNVIDNATGNSVTTENITGGNTALRPEIADSFGIGLVFQPEFLQGFSASADYWEIDVSDAINTVTAQNIVDLCFQGNTDFCAAINNGSPLRETTGSDRNTIRIQPFNLAQQLASGVDLEASYALPAQVFGGDIGMRFLATHFIENYRDDTLTQPTDTVGENRGSGPPDWRWNASLNFSRETFSATLSARGVSDGVFSNTQIECVSGCPVSTIANPTINVNHLSGATYLDLSLSKTTYAGSDNSIEVQWFLNVKNLANKDPVLAVGGPGGIPYDTVSTNAANYDTQGRVFRAGVRVSL